MSFVQELLQLKMKPEEEMMIASSISNWLKIQDIMDAKRNDAGFPEFLQKALSVELRTKRRKSIVKRLHQALHNLRRKEEYTEISNFCDRQAS